MYNLIDKIDQGVATKTRHTLIEKSGRHHHGILVDSWIRISGGKLRGKLVFESEEKGRVEVDAHDILDVLPLVSK